MKLHNADAVRPQQGEGGRKGGREGGSARSGHLPLFFFQVIKMHGGECSWKNNVEQKKINKKTQKQNMHI